MPTYDYLCEIHGEFEETHSILEELLECPNCKKNNLKSKKPIRLISKSNFILIGSGWSKDNYK